MTAKLSINKAAGAPVKRVSQYTDGIKRGLLNRTADKLISQFADPVAEKLQPMLNNIHPGLQMAETQFKSLISFGMLIALAEVIAMAGPALAKIPGTGMSKEDAVEKCQAFAEYLRNYAGEKLGMNVAELAASVVPMLVDVFKNMDPQAFLGAINEHQNEEQAQEEEQAQPA